MIGLIDADLIDGGTRHPNLALMKLSGYEKARGHKTKLLLDYNSLGDYDIVYLSKVFTATKIPIDVTKCKNLRYGGTGFFLEKAPNLPTKVEHSHPDYHLYDQFIGREIKRGIKPDTFKDYRDFSIGFTTRGCFRKCSFCVNRKYNRAVIHAPIREFLDDHRKYIYLWDDNILAYARWENIFNDLNMTGKRFQFKQGLDIRLLTDRKAKVLSESNYLGDYIFAFDHIKDRNLIEDKLKLWRKYSPNSSTKLYILCAYETQDIQDIIGVFERIKILMRYKCLPYIMRFSSYEESEYRGIYITIARWCNQPSFFKKKTFREFCRANGKSSSAWRYFKEFEKKNPMVSKKYSDMRYPAVGSEEQNE